MCFETIQGEADETVEAIVDRDPGDESPEADEPEDKIVWLKATVITSTPLSHMAAEDFPFDSDDDNSEEGRTERAQRILKDYLEGATTGSRPGEHVEVELIESHSLAAA